MLKHKHHIVPRHMGGTDDPSNLIELTVEEHAEAHRKLYEQYGLIEDKLAWKGLTGLIDKAEIFWILSKERCGEKHHNYGIKRPDHAALMREQMKGENNPMYGKEPWNKGLTKADPRVTYGRPGHKGIPGNQHGKGNIGKVQDEEWKRKRLDKIKGPHEVVTCPTCGKEGGIRSMKRWHGLAGDLCKNTK